MNRHICYWCGYDRFEHAATNDVEIMPDSVLFIWAMWQFDKGGFIQELLHSLKYNHLRGVGNELGYIAGRTFLDRMDADTLQFLDARNPVLIPVPLHAAKRRKRGYNQARALAEGLSVSLKWDLCEADDVIRIRKTRTQTGLTTLQRADNLKGAFKMTNNHLLDDENRFPILVDDVITTGATTYELASAICSSGVRCGILAIARA
ncbi:ComF family protein [Rhodohalobacter mucosus]|uniref:ComF family protein n=1 Tax=Rhodohalobacter mucosus TaxID=2079485 RepID=A0A316TSF1_9BACT|nr:ComF family protein [Rhodohalobacter mucosus]PWN06798.1 ComF family protein [Rhodohalobacter mucosus]